jgi:hypothetical protein
MIHYHHRVALGLAVTIAIAASCLPAAPAGAIIGGQPDRNGHPYVAAIGQPDGAGIYFTGTAISPTVVLTAAHAVVRLERLGFTMARLTFDPVVSASSTWYTGTIHVDPAYDPTNTTNSNDLAVIALDAPVTGITPASLPTEGLLDQLASKGTRAPFDLVGYGISRYTGAANGGGSPTLDFSSTGTRELAQESFSSITSAWLHLQVNGGAAACIGDSGAPSLVGGTDVVAGIFILEGSLSGGQCQSQPWDIRVDTPSARAFLGQYTTLR